MQSDKNQSPWFLKPAAIILAALFLGPLAIPLVWMSGELKNWHKWLITALLIALGALLFKSSVDMYNLMLKNLADLREIIK